MVGSTNRRAIGIARVSVEGRRTEERLYSYDEQAEAIESSCRRDGLNLLYVGRERNVSGGADLANRPELSRAVAAVEAGDADLIVVAYFDRFFRSLAVQHDVVARIEAAGGELLALDHGRLTNGSAAERLSSNMMGAVSQFYREQAGEKSRAGQASAVARGALPWARVPWGYRRRADGTVEPVPELVPLVREVFDRRAAGESVTQLRRFLRDHDIDRTARGVQQMLGQRLYLGELHFKTLVNLHACEPIVDRDVFDRVQRMVIPRGPQPMATRLLSRLRVLRCSGCGTPLGTMKLPKQDDRAIYRCPSTNIDCPNHVTIYADVAEDWVWQQVKARLADAEGRATANERHARVAAARDEAQARLDRAVRSFSDAGLVGEAAAVETLQGLRAARDAAQDELDVLPADTGHVVVRVDDDLTDSVRRDLIRTVVKAVTVAPSRGTGLRGADRLSIVFH
jgi:DNA invertase Pin-like site-specific DNA recombinase